MAHSFWQIEKKTTHMVLYQPTQFIVYWFDTVVLLHGGKTDSEFRVDDNLLIKHTWKKHWIYLMNGEMSKVEEHSQMVNSVDFKINPTSL